MSLIGERIPTDEHYPTSVLFGIETAYDGLFGKEDASIGSLGYIFRTMEEIKSKTEFLYDRKSAFRSHDGLAYRRGAWGVIDEVLSAELGTAYCETREQRAEWFQGILKLTTKYMELRELIADFKTGLAKLSLKLSIGDASEAVSLILDPELTGKEAYKTALTVVARLKEKAGDFIALSQQKQILEGA